MLQSIERILENRRLILAIAESMAIAIAAGDLWLRDHSLGILYVFPTMVAAPVLRRWEVVFVSFGLALLREALTPSPWSGGAAARVSMALAAFSGLALFVRELARNLANLRQIQLEVRLRETAEAEARQLVESSPGAIVTAAADGRILRANRAARELLAPGGEIPEGRNITGFLPMLSAWLSPPSRGVVPDAPAPPSHVRTLIEGDGRRLDGAPFYAQAWVSSYQTPVGPRIAAIFTDATDVLRDREELGLRQLMASSRIVAAALSHEIRNLSAAAHTIYGNLGQKAEIGAHEDYRALGALIEGLRKLSSEELGPAVEEVRTGVDLPDVLRELEMILEPTFRDSGTELRWQVSDGLPRVRADHSSLLQVFLNLAQNSHRAVQGVPEKWVVVTACRRNQSVIVSFENNGPAIPDSDRLFQPLQPKAASHGLGLFVSRALMRTYGGELRYQTRKENCCFLVEMPCAEPAAEVA